MKRISILTGEIQSGKTSLGGELADLARSRGIKPGGLLSPAVFSAGKKTAIDVLDLKTGQRKRLAELKESQSSRMETRRWAFLPDAVAWGNRQLLQSVPCDLLLIDELGPLEFFQQTGWVNSFKVLQQGGYQAALLVIRPSLIQEASRRWDIFQIFDLSEPAISLPSADLVLNQLLSS